MRTRHPLLRVLVIAGRGAFVISALGWLISIVGVVVPSSTAFAILNDLGALDLPYNPMLDYWLRMTSFAFAFIGFLFAIAAIRWRKSWSFALLLALFQFICGVVLFAAKWQIGLANETSNADAFFAWRPEYLW
jgi:hypothetical protein